MTHIIAGITGVTVIAVVGKLVATKLIRVVVSRLGRIAASAIAGAIARGIAGLAIDVIATAIAGAYERLDLQETIEQLDKQIDEFLPASQDYTDTVYEVIAEVKVWKRHGCYGNCMSLRLES